MAQSQPILGGYVQYYGINIEVMPNITKIVKIN